MAEIGSPIEPNKRKKEDNRDPFTQVIDFMLEHKIEVGLVILAIAIIIAMQANKIINTFDFGESSTEASSLE